MNTESEKLTAEQSLDIITTMIRQAQGNVRKNTFYFLLWGWVVTLAHLGMYVLTKVAYPYPFIVWLITIPAWIITLYKAFKGNRAQVVHSHLDRITGAIWLTFGICIFTLVFFGYKINYQLTPVILLVSAIPTFVSGIILRFTPLMLGGASFLVFGIVSFLLPFELQPLAGAVAIVCGYLLPGYLLKNKKD
jgi:hypothetical protein